LTTEQRHVAQAGTITRRSQVNIRFSGESGGFTGGIFATD
jgi:hypothetical protein